MGTRSSIFISLALVLPTLAVHAAIEQPITVVPDYRNPVSLTGNHPPCVTSYSGHVLTYKAPGSAEPAEVPSSTSYLLMQSAFGQLLSAALYPDYVNDTLRRAQDLLYYNTTPGASAELNEKAAFRYKVYLYTRDATEGKVGTDSLSSPTVRADFEAFPNMYGDQERVRAAYAEDLVLEALRNSPMDPKIWNIFLDVYYDRAVAEIQFIKLKLANLSALRLGLTASKPNQVEMVIDQEIEFYKSILEGHEYILDQYSRLFTESFGIDVGRYDPEAESGAPIGYYVFQKEVPYRSLFAAQFRDNDGVVRTVPDRYGNSEPRQLFAGYRDYVLLLGVLRDYARDAAQLAQDYALRGAPGDYAEAGNLLDRVQTELVFDKDRFEALFSGYPPEGDPDNAGVRAALQGVAVGLGGLSEMKSFLKGEVNFLGFDPDFLILIQEYPLQIPEGNRFDSYDAIIAWLGQEYSPLQMAELTYAQARDAYQTYRGYADQVVNELSALEITYHEEYFRIVGALPDDPTYNVMNPAPDSELAIVNLRIEMCKDKMDSLKDRHDVLYDSINTATDFRDNAANDKINSITSAYDTYKNTVNPLWNAITVWNAAQAGAQAAYDTVSDCMAIGTTAGGSINPVGAIAGAAGIEWTVIAGALNTAIQVEGEVVKGIQQKLIDRAQAEYQKEIALVDVQLLQNEAEARLADLEEEKVSVTIDTYETQLMLDEESATWNILMRRASRALQMLEQNQQRVADRYYADPIHYLRAQNKVIEAEFAFREAQEWAFFAARALEYKYNKPFLLHFMERDWQISTLFQLRNYDELDNFFAAMNEFNLVNLTSLIGRNSFTDCLSVRKDFWPYVDTVLDGGVERPAQYFSSDGERLLSSVEKFREEVRSRIDRDNQIVLQLDTTNLTKTEGAFFIGPEYNNDLCVIQAGKWLDKIEWIKINLVGTHPERAFTGGDFAYGGNTYIRALQPPCPETDLEIPGDWMVYPFRFFFTLDNGETWQSRDAQAFTPIMRFSNTSAEPEGSDYENRGLKERSVAASRITLKIPAVQANIDQLDDIEIYVRHFFADRIAPICPGCPGKPVQKADARE